MKKVLSLMMAGLLVMIMSGTPVYADMGIPTEPDYTVMINIYGADYYKTYDDFLNGNSAGRLAGGQTFYVWDTYYEEALYGTTDPNGTMEHPDNFVFIFNGEGMDPTEMISPDVGTKGEETVTATTTDALNLRYGPGTGFKIIKTLDKGTEVTYEYTFNTDTTWMYVNASGTSGWVSGDYLQKKAAVKNTAENETKPELTPVEEPEATGSLQKNETAKGKDKRLLVAGIICICAGAAILIAVLAAYLLKNRSASS